MVKRYFSSPYSLLVLTIALSLGTFIQILDFSVANVSLPQIAHDFGINVGQTAWIITSYTVSSAIMLAITGWLAARFGAVKVFLTSLFMFSVTSALCGLAPTINTLIFFRTLQGFSGGALVPLSQTLLLMNYPHSERGRALGLWSTMIILAPLVGPFVGGALTSFYGWRWIFLINIPLGILCLLVTYYLIEDEETDIKKVSFDLRSFIFLGLGVCSLQIFLDKGHAYHWFHSSFIVFTLISAILFIALFIVSNIKSKEPIFDFSLLKNKSFVISTVVASFAFLIFIGSSLILAFWLQLGLNYSPVEAGISLMPIGIFPVLLSSFVGKSLSRIDPRYYLTLSFLFFAATFFWLSSFTVDVSQQEFLLLRMLQGLGPTLYFIPILTLALSSIPKRQLASATGFFNFSRLLSGGGIGVAIFITLWERYNPDKTFTNLSYTLAMNDIAYWSGVGFLIIIPLVWLCHYQRTESH